MQNKFSLEGTVNKLDRIDPKPGAKFTMGAKFMLRVPHDKGDRFDNLPMAAWNKEAEYILEAGEGATLLCTGRIGRRMWEKQDGSKQYETTLTVGNAAKVAAPHQSETGF